MLTLMKMLKFSKENVQALQQIVPSQPMLKFINNIILGFLYGMQQDKSQEILLKLPGLPPYQKKKSKTLIFDLDETLITSKMEADQVSHLFEMAIDDEIIKFNIAIRPYAKEILEYLSQDYEIIVFTASSMEYAEKIINILDPQRKIVKLILDRTYCYQTIHGVFIKDLRILKGIDLDSVLMIDNSSLSYCFQPQNGVPLLPWYGDKNDNELYNLALYLKTIAESQEKIVLEHAKQFPVKGLFQLYNQFQF